MDYLISYKLNNSNDPDTEAPMKNPANKRS